MTEITPRLLIDAGIPPGKWIPEAVRVANQTLAGGAALSEAIDAARALAPQRIALQEPPSFHVNAIGENDAERANIRACVDSMAELMKTPVVRAGALMPDTCPAGPMGTIPVGGVAASVAIHPGMHSSDICCSMMLSVHPDKSPAELLDAVHQATHFGPGGRDDLRMSDRLAERFASNYHTVNLIDIGHHHMGTQGDGNHFAYVGTMESTGETVLVTHHGSRGVGARLYKKGMQIADRYRRELCPEVHKGNAWIPADTEDGDTYWEALQIVREWTRENHERVHDVPGAAPSDRFWNEHNFVFRKPDGLFYHGKGATPAFDDWAEDATDLTIIPLNMAEPVLIVRGSNADNGLGFSPHGAGRNYSRSQHRRVQEGRPVDDIVSEETEGLDARFFMGIPDITELPSAYKDAAIVRAQIEQFGLAEIVDQVLPYGCIMAGDWEQEAPWRKKKKRMPEST